MPDFDQKRKWSLLDAQARTLSAFFTDEIERQVEVLGSPVAKNLYMETVSGEGVAPDISEPARTRLREQSYDNFRQDVSRSERVRGVGRREKPLEVLPADIIFSTDGQHVRVPYLGLIRHRPNNKIIAASENAAWAMGNVTSARLVVRNQRLCLVIDTREDPSLRTKRKPPAKRKSSKWLT